ncbi:hypothetical protein K435DRAFT_712134, partial [Dendrothele bispora CBS 962.96]
MSSPQHPTWYTTTLATANTSLALLQPYDAHLGFDLEWKPNYVPGRPENPVALVQLASEHHTFLVQVSRMRPQFPLSVQQVLENPCIPKTGVGIQGDVKKLWSDCHVSVTSCVDLSLFARSVDYALFAQRLGPYKDVSLKIEAPRTLTPQASIAESNPESSGEPAAPNSAPPMPPSPHDARLWKGRYRDPIGLARLAKAYNNKELSKGRITRSNWEASLSAQQIEYAAEDARAGYTVYEHLLALFFTLPEDKRPKRKYYAFDCIQGELYLPLDPESREPIGPLLPQRTSWTKWSMQNPEYDPGPSPPKKDKRTKDNNGRGKEKEKENGNGNMDEDKNERPNINEAQDEEEISGSETTTSTPRRRPRRRRRKTRPNSNGDTLSMDLNSVDAAALPAQFISGGGGTAMTSSPAAFVSGYAQGIPVSGGVKLGMSAQRLHDQNPYLAHVTGTGTTRGGRGQGRGAEPGRRGSHRSGRYYGQGSQDSSNRGMNHVI